MKPNLSSSKDVGQNESLCPTYLLPNTIREADFRKIYHLNVRFARYVAAVSATRVPMPFFIRLEYDADAGVQNLGNAPQGAEGVSFVTGRLKPADLLLGS